MKRQEIAVDGVTASYLTAGDTGPVILMLHGTYWSRVWAPLIDDLAARGFRPIAVDFPGSGRSDGELTLETASVPALAEWTVRFVRALGLEEPIFLAGHDIGGGVAQHLAVATDLKVARLALVNAVLYDSWPVPGVARFKDPAVARATTVADVLEARRISVIAALARPASNALIAEYLDPWTRTRVAQSWLALAGAADSRYTMGLLERLKASPIPKLLVWGVDDGFQKLEYAERFQAEIPNTQLIRIPAAGHIPMENDAELIVRALSRFFGS